MKMLTEDQIERRVEHMIDRLDARYMSGRLTPEQYSAEVRKVDEWAQREYQFCRAANRILDMELRS